MRNVVGAWLRSLPWAGLLAMATAACASDPDVGPQRDDSSTLAEDGTDTSEVETDAQVITSSLVAASAGGTSLTLASTGELQPDGPGPRGVGEGAKALYFPRKCLSVSSEESTRTVRYEFKNCSGPNGIFRIHGALTATYETSPGMLVLRLVGTDLRINRAVVDWSASAEIRARGPSRTMEWNGTLSGTTRRGTTFSRTSRRKVEWGFGERCFRVAGVSEGRVRERSVRTELRDFQRCQGSCPEAGGRIVVSNDLSERLDIVFDGSENASYSTNRPGNVAATVDLACAR